MSEVDILNKTNVSASDIARIRSYEISATYTSRAHDALVNLEKTIPTHDIWDANRDLRIKWEQNHVLRNINQQDYTEKKILDISVALYEKHEHVFNHFFSGKSLEDIICVLIPQFLKQFSKGMNIHVSSQRILCPARPIYNDIALAIGLYEENAGFGLTLYGDVVITQYITIHEKTF